MIRRSDDRFMFTVEERVILKNDLYWNTALHLSVEKRKLRNDKTRWYFPKHILAFCVQRKFLERNKITSKNFYSRFLCVLSIHKKFDIRYSSHFRKRRKNEKFSRKRYIKYIQIFLEFLISRLICWSNHSDVLVINAKHIFAMIHIKIRKLAPMLRDVIVMRHASLAVSEFVMPGCGATPWIAEFRTSSTGPMPRPHTKSTITALADALGYAFYHQRPHLKSLKSHTRIQHSFGYKIIWIRIRWSDDMIQHGRWGLVKSYSTTRVKTHQEEN